MANGDANGAAAVVAAAANGNGAAEANGTPAAPAVIASSVAVAAVAAAAAASTAPASTSNGNGNGSVAMTSLDIAVDPQVAGQIETVAATATATTTKPVAPAAEAAKSEPKRTAAGTPYKNPGGRWSQFKSYSTFQVRRCSSPAHALRTQHAAAVHRIGHVRCNICYDAIVVAGPSPVCCARCVLPGALMMALHGRSYRTDPNHLVRAPTNLPRSARTRL